MALLDELRSSLQARDPLPPLLPTQVFARDISLQITRASDAELFGNEALSDEQKQSLRSGLLLLNDDLHASHDISQSIKTPTGSFWHAIMHRREGDAGNSNYWWRLTGIYPAFVPLFENAHKYLHTRSEAEARDFKAKMEREGRWNPTDFVRACSNASGDNEWLRGLQMVEMSTLLGWCRSNS